MLKNRRVYKVFGLLLCISSINLHVGGMLIDNKEQNESFEISRPLSEWPKISQSSRQEEICYELTWDKNRSLEENRCELINRFLSICCDFSFRVKESTSNGIYSGEFDTGESIVFVNKEMHTFVDLESDRVTFFSENDKQEGLEVHPITSMMENIKPINFEEWMVGEFERYVQRFAEDPVGCEILRRSIAKYEASQIDLPKIRFIPTDDQKMTLAYTAGSYVWKYVKRRGRPSFGMYAEYCRENRFIVFSPEWFNADQEGLILKLKRKKTDLGSERFAVDMGIMPREASLMYQIIYAIHAIKNDDHNKTQVIENRDAKNYFCGSFEGVGPFSIARKRINVSIFRNDKIYRVMYGLTKHGFDLINESSYLAHKYNFIRPAYTGSQTRMHVNGKVLDKKESAKFLKTFLRTNGDFDLYKYFLSSKSPIKYPEFGVGQYRCSDVDFERKRTNRMSHRRK